ncbi:MAG TPA: hypothetical protein VGE04_00465 [Chloroflexia bacterium]|jgi:hypothetical protein
MTRSGEDAQQLGAMAETTFRELLDSWMHPSYSLASQLLPDTQKADVRHLMPSFSSDIGPLSYIWQIKAVSHRPREYESGHLKCTCLRLRLDPKYVRDIMAVAQNEPRFYLALAILKDIGGSLSDLAPKDRFEWYVVDLGQYCRKLGPADQPSYIDIPTQNRLNLSLFSLIWGANWVDTYFEPLRREIGNKPRTIDKLVRSFQVNPVELGTEASHLLEDAVGSLGSLRDELDAKSYQRFVEPLAITGSLRAIVATLSKGHRAEKIENYCPEALAGTANLWLFSRTYHEFMRLTQLCGESNLRLLPVKDDLSTLPRFFRATLFNVRTFYSSLEAKVKIVKMLEEDGGSDYSHYSDALDPFPWVHVDPRTGHATIEQSRFSADRDDLEQIRIAEKRLLTDKGINISEGGDFGDLRWPELRLGGRVPVCLFRQEDRYLEHPVDLWEIKSPAVYIL